MDDYETTRRAVARWHEAVNAADLDAVREAVGDPVVVNGPKGSAVLDPGQFCEWVTRSGIRLRPVSHHPVTGQILVVEQEARWPEDTGHSRVATVFRVHGGAVTAALRFPGPAEALAFAQLHRDLAATEPGRSA